MAQALDQVTYPINGSGKDGLDKSTQVGHSFGRQQAGVSCWPLSECQPHLQQHQGIFGLEGQVYDATSFFDLAQSLLGKRLVFRPCRWNR